MADYRAVFALRMLISLLRVLHENADVLEHDGDQGRMDILVCFSACLRHGRLVCLHSGLCSSV